LQAINPNYAIADDHVIIHFSPDSQQPFSGFKAQSVENTSLVSTVSAVETCKTLSAARECSGYMFVFLCELCVLSEAGGKKILPLTRIGTYNK